MSYVLVLFQVRPDYPLIVASDRIEGRDRPSSPPVRWEGQPTIWAGRDETAGGTWLGVNSAGVFAALTNRQRQPTDRSRPSRGELVVDALRAQTPAAALHNVQARLAASPYNAFNLVCANAREGWITTWQSRTRQLRPGIHTITNRGEADDGRRGVIRRTNQLVAAMDLRAPLEKLLNSLGGLCADTGGTDPICVPGGGRGTVSSSLLALDSRGRVAAYWYADGPPTSAKYEPVKVG